MDPPHRFRHMPVDNRRHVRARRLADRQRPENPLAHPRPLAEWSPILSGLRRQLNGDGAADTDRGCLRRRWRQGRGDQ
jgi:hypothetical protein